MQLPTWFSQVSVTVFLELPAKALLIQICLSCRIARRGGRETAEIFVQVDGEWDALRPSWDIGAAETKAEIRVYILHGGYIEKLGNKRKEFGPIITGQNFHISSSTSWSDITARGSSTLFYPQAAAFQALATKDQT